MLLDKSIMKSFGDKLDWTTECLSFQDSKHTIPAIHVRRSVQSQYCSVITQTAQTQPIPVLVRVLVLFVLFVFTERCTVHLFLIHIFTWTKKILFGYIFVSSTLIY